MKQNLLFVLLAVMGLSLVMSSCQKAPELTVSGPTNIELSADGSSASITFTANRDWKVTSSDSWVSVSPSSGTAADGAVSVTVRCNANTTYEDRTATVTIKMEDLSQAVTVKQPANLGIVLPTQSYDLQADAKSIEVTVQANVQYSVSSSVDWIKQTGTKALTSKTLTFSIAENKTYDAREGKITLKPQQGNVQEQVITVRQAQKDALIVEKTSYDMPYGGGEIEIKVEANVAFDVSPNVDWLNYTQTKALSTSTVCIKVDENSTYSNREGKIDIIQKNGTLKHTITVKQAGRIAVSSVELNKTNLQMKEGDTESLVATVKPDNATDKTVAWSSSDTSVASVDENGKVTAIKEGSATITAKAGEKTSTCSIYVENVITLNGNGESTNCFIIIKNGKYRIRCSSEIEKGATSAFLLWNENGEHDIKNVELSDEYVYFEKPAFVKGNALISVMGDSGIINSWHIWSTDEPEYIDGVLDRNLGATSTEANNNDAYGLVYSYGSPFPFPGAKYKDWILTNEPSVPDGWYVASGYGFYAADKMPSEATPMLYCTNRDKYGNSIFWRNTTLYSPLPYGTARMTSYALQELVGYEPTFNGLNGVKMDNGLFFPAAGRPTLYTFGLRIDEVGLCGAYWGNGIYNNAAVDARACWFYEGISKATSYYRGNELRSIRAIKK